MSNQDKIDYLNSVKTSNTAKISENDSTILGIDDAITGLNQQITDMNTQKSSLQSQNTQSADNSMIDDIITLL